MKTHDWIDIGPSNNRHWRDDSDEEISACVWCCSGCYHETVMVRFLTPQLGDEFVYGIRFENELTRDPNHDIDNIGVVRIAPDCNVEICKAILSE